MGPQDVLEISVLIGVRRLGRKRHHPAAADDLVAGDLGLYQVLVDRKGSRPGRCRDLPEAPGVLRL